MVNIIELVFVCSIIPREWKEITRVQPVRWVTCCNYTFANKNLWLSRCTRTRTQKTHTQSERLEWDWCEEEATGTFEFQRAKLEWTFWEKDAHRFGRSLVRAQQLESSTQVPMAGKTTTARSISSLRGSFVQYHFCLLEHWPKQTSVMSAVSVQKW